MAHVRDFGRGAWKTGIDVYHKPHYTQRPGAASDEFSYSVCFVFTEPHRRLQEIAAPTPLAILEKAELVGGSRSAAAV